MITDNQNHGIAGRSSRSQSPLPTVTGDEEEDKNDEVSFGDYYVSLEDSQKNTKSNNMVCNNGSDNKDDNDNHNNHQRHNYYPADQFENEFDEEKQRVHHNYSSSPLPTTRSSSDSSSYGYTYWCCCWVPAPDNKNKKEDKNMHVGTTAQKNGSASPTKDKASINNNENIDSNDDNNNRVWEQFYSFRVMAMPYFQESWTGRCYFLVLVVFMLLNSTVKVFFSYLARDFWSALAEQEQEEFYAIMTKFLVALLVLAPINVFYRFQRQRLAINWREWMTDRIIQLYYSNRVYYVLERSGDGGSGGSSGAGLSRNHKNGGGINFSSFRNCTGIHGGCVKPEDMCYSGNSNSSNSNYMNNKGIDNPDQRIAEDVRSFTQYSLSLFLTIAVSLIDLVSFSVILFTIRPQLFISIILFATFGTIATVVIGKTLVGLNFERLHLEADFRYSLLRIRENAESIAFFGGEDIEGREVYRRFQRVISNMKNIIGTQRNLDFFTTLYNYITWILPLVVVAPEYFEGNIEMGVVQQASAAFNHVLDDLSIIVNEFESLSQFSAGIDRLYQFVCAVQKADPDRELDSPLMQIKSPPPPPSQSSQSSFIKNDGCDHWVLVSNESSASKLIKKTLPSKQIDLRQMPPAVLSNVDHEKRMNICPPTAAKATKAALTGESRSSNNGIFNTAFPSVPVPVALSIKEFSLCTPDLNRVLINNMNLSLKWGENLLIVGPSGGGKSSLLRAIAGLWTAGSGSIERPNDQDIYFLPQKPYCALGSLRDQLLYPSINCTMKKKGDGDENGCDDDDVNINNYRNSSSSYYCGDDNYPNDYSHNLPQRAHILKQNLSDQDLIDILDAVDLSELARRVGNGNAVKGLDMVMDWTNTLSLGEQQRLAFGRILVNRPRLVIMDESTSAMDVASENKMYSLLRKVDRVRKEKLHPFPLPPNNNCNTTIASSNGGDHICPDAATTTITGTTVTAASTAEHGPSTCAVADDDQYAYGLTYISVGHRPTLLSHHNVRLHLMDADNYSVDRIAMASTDDVSVD